MHGQRDFALLLGARRHDNVDDAGGAVELEVGAPPPHVLRCGLDRDDLPRRPDPLSE
jgi:hypothetical protein